MSNTPPPDTGNPNTPGRPTPPRLDGERLRRIRERMNLTQEELAVLIRHEGKKVGEPNACNRRLIQKWESGNHATVRPNYKRALMIVTGLPFSSFCFTPAAPGMSSTPGVTSIATPDATDRPPAIPLGPADRAPGSASELVAQIDRTIAELEALRARITTTPNTLHHRED
jgi:transcriptional regulator with XRE-family HTH domain